MSFYVDLVSGDAIKMSLNVETRFRKTTLESLHIKSILCTNKIFSPLHCLNIKNICIMLILE